jgi:hypothetical protein
MPRGADFAAIAAAPRRVGRMSENWEILVQAVPTTLENDHQLCRRGCGEVLAFAIIYAAWLREALYPHLDMFQMIPKITLAPLFIVWLGVGSRSCVVFGTFIAFFPVVVSTVTGLVSANPEIPASVALADCERLADSSYGTVSPCDAVCVRPHEGCSDNGGDRCHCRRIRHPAGRGSATSLC